MKCSRFRLEKADIVTIEVSGSNVSKYWTSASLDGPANKTMTALNRCFKGRNKKDETSTWDASFPCSANKATYQPYAVHLDTGRGCQHGRHVKEIQYASAGERSINDGPLRSVLLQRLALCAPESATHPCVSNVCLCSPPRCLTCVIRSLRQ